MTEVVSSSGNSSSVPSSISKVAAALSSARLLLLPLLFFLPFLLDSPDSVIAIGLDFARDSGCVYFPFRGGRRQQRGGILGVCDFLNCKIGSVSHSAPGRGGLVSAGGIDLEGAERSLKEKSLSEAPASVARRRRWFRSNDRYFGPCVFRVLGRPEADGGGFSLSKKSASAAAHRLAFLASHVHSKSPPLFAESRATDLMITKMTPEEEAKLTPTQRAQVEESQRHIGPWRDTADPYATYVAMHGGKKAIRRILIANNGMAASKAIASMRQWSFETFGDSHLLKFVAMASPDDLDANSEFLKFADEIVPVPGGPSRNNYGNVDLICESAVKYKVDAVWPGWGHASENPALPAKLKELGVSFLGPSSSVMAALGDKIAANILAQTAGVPSIPWSGDGLQAHLDETGAIPKEIYQAATVHTLEECQAAARRIGYPLLLKASAGGGGKGIRMVFEEDALGPALAQVQAEVLGSPVFLMKLSRGARHIEVQIAGDCERQAVALSGRDCSTQRRFQKIFEEAPPTVVPKATFREMERAAQRLTMSLGYQGLGTVEYLYDPILNAFYFLELNPRLQVEHPVTEAVTDQNLPALQLQLAMDIPLRRVPSIRKLFGKSADGAEPIDFLQEEYRPPAKHVIAARVTAENPSDGFRPSSGFITSVDFQPPEGAWGYFAVASGGKIHAYADSQFGHIFAEGSDRDTARRRLIWALQRLRIRGNIRTPLFLLQRLLQAEPFKNHTLNTEWLDGIIKRKELLEGPRDQDVVFAGAVFRALQEMNKKEAEWVGMAERGHSYLPAVGSLLSEEVTLSLNDIEYKFHFTKLGPNTLGFKINGDSGFVEYRLQPDGALLLLIKQREGGALEGDTSFARNVLGLEQRPRMLRFFGQEEALGLLLQIDGQQLLLQQQQDPSLLRSEANGKVVRFLVPDGGVVEKGQAFAELEAMKMIMTLTAKEKGKITHLKSAGSLVAAGELLARLELEDASKVQTLTPFAGKFSVGLSALSEPTTEQSETSAERKEHQVQETAEAAEARLMLLLDGYRQQLPLEILVEIALKRMHSLEHLEELATSCAAKFLSVEELFAGKENIDAAEAVSAAAAGKASAILDIHRSHFLIKEKAKLIALLLKAYRERFRIQAESSPGEAFFAVLERLARLRGPSYIAVSLASENLLNELRLPLLSERVMQAREKLKQSGTSSESSLDDALLSERESLAGFGILANLFADPEVGVAAVSAAVKRQMAGLEMEDLKVERLSQPQERVARFSFNARPPRGESAVACDRKEGLFVSCNFLHQMSHALHEALRQSGETRKPSLVLLSCAAPCDATDEAVREEVSSILQKAFADSSVAPALRELTTLRILLPDARGDTRQFVFVRKDAEQREATPEAFVEDAQQRNRSEAQIRLLGVCDLAKEGNVRHFPSSHTSAIAPSAAAVDEFVYSFSRKPLPPKPGVKTTPPQETLYIHRVLFTKAPLQKEQLVAELKQQLAVLTSSLKDFEAAKSTSSVLVLQLASLHAEGQVADLRETLRLAVESLKETESERLRSLRVEAIELRATVEIDSHRRRLAVLRAGSFDKGLWLEVEQREGLLSQVSLPQKETESSSTDPNLALLVQTLEKAEGLGGSARASLSSSSTRSSRNGSLLQMHESAGASSTSIPSSGSSSAGSQGSQSAQSPVERSSSALSPKEASSPTLRSLAVERLAAKRAAAAKAGSTYIYDFVPLFKEGLKKLWRDRRSQASEAGISLDASVSEDDLLSAEELLPDAHGKLAFTSSWRVGDSPCGMVAFKLRIRTPDHPEGREVILIGNDVTFQGGSFGVKEHCLYTAASAYARRHKLPRIYIACNSGARIGLYDKIKHKLKVRWIDADNPHLGVDSLALSEEDFAALPPGAVTGRWAQVLDADGNATSREFVLQSIIGEDDQDLGVENLRGSGAIAGETSQAYDDIFTISLVSGRSVGIGAYVTRLAQRCIQREGAPLVLTGYQALNKLLGRDVYVSQAQLGGPEVMLPNGIAHMQVKSDLEGVFEILKWLEFVPRDANRVHTGSSSFDSVNRRVDFQPTKVPYDPRLMLTGHASADDGQKWVSGFFDKNSFVEVLRAWGSGVVVGRAKLGGLPVGVIAVDPRSTTATIPADPANPNSAKIVTPQAGQVWFPSTAYKTAQAINDFNRGENLPLIIFANWRGFSGGARDMFNEVLKFGSMIVDALRVYRHPVMVYIPPHAELRGGSWVVIDPSINPNMMELYADKESRGGVLEPPGICEVKYKATDKKLLMQQNDNVIRRLQQALNEAKMRGDTDQANEIRRKIEEREEKLLPVYTQVAHMFADLHDKAPRMLAKGGVRRVLDWPLARQFFFWRIKRRLLSDPIIKEIIKDRPELSWSEAADILKAAIPKVREDVEDEDAVKFLQSQEGATMVAELLQRQQAEGTKLHFKNLLERIQRLPDADRQGLIQQLQK